MHACYRGFQGISIELGCAMSAPCGSARSLPVAAMWLIACLLLTTCSDGQTAGCQLLLARDLTESCQGVGAVMCRPRPGGGHKDRRPLHRVQLQHLSQQGR